MSGRIKSFKCKETEKIFRQEYSAKLPSNIQRIMLRKLMMIDNADTIGDLKSPSGNRLENLNGSQKNRYSIRVNDQYRICFHLGNDGFYDVEVVDYH